MSKKPTKIEKSGYLVGYARVSTEEQNLELQIEALKRAGVSEHQLHVEKVSGASKRRQALDLAIKDLEEGDTLVVWRLDRFGRSVRDIYARLDRIVAKGASFRSLTEHFDMSTAMGRLYLHIAAAFAEFERQIISQRTKAGIETWMAKGKGKWGRQPKLTEAQVVKIGKELNSGIGGPTLATKYKVSTATIYRYWQLDRHKRKFIRNPETR